MLSLFESLRIVFIIAFFVLGHIASYVQSAVIIAFLVLYGTRICKILVEIDMYTESYAHFYGTCTYFMAFYIRNVAAKGLTICMTGLYIP